MWLSPPLYSPSSCVNTALSLFPQTRPQRFVFSLLGMTEAFSLHASRLCGCCQLLSRQCRSCVAISSYIWLLGLWRFSLLPGQASPNLASIGCWCIPILRLAATRGGLHPVTPQTGCSLCHNSTRGPCQAFFFFFLLFRHSSLILPSLCLVLSKILFVVKSWKKNPPKHGKYLF